MKDVSRDAISKQLAADFKAAVADADALIKATASQGDEKLEKVRARAEESLAAAKDSLGELQSAASRRTDRAARVTDEYVHDRPWQSMGVAACIGLLAGFLLTRR